MPESTRERRQFIQLSDEEMERLAEKAAKRALEKVYADVGKAVAAKIFLIILVGGIAMFIGVRADKVMALFK